MSEQFPFDETPQDEQAILPDLYYPSEQDLIEGTETIYQTPIDGLYFIGERVFEDSRGSFSMWGKKSEIETAVGRPFEVAQTNLSKSKPGVIRGIHAEYEDKLISVSAGTALASIVDCRPDSQTVGSVVQILLGDDVDYRLPVPTRGSLFIKGKGIGNSFIALRGPDGESPNSMVSYVYAVSREYQDLSSEEQKPLYMFDPTIGIKWPTNLSIGEMLSLGLISQRDLLQKDGGQALTFEEFLELRRKLMGLT